AYSMVSRSVHSNNIGSLTAPTAVGSIAMRVSSRLKFHAFSAPNHRKPFTAAPSAGQAIAMPNRSVVWKTSKISKVLAVLAATVMVGACGGGTQTRRITLTFIRNAQSQANADGVIDTSDPGPSLTADGKGQAQQIAHARADFDSIYASAMTEAQ